MTADAGRSVLNAQLVILEVLDAAVRSGAPVSMAMLRAIPKAEESGMLAACLEGVQLTALGHNDLFFVRDVPR